MKVFVVLAKDCIDPNITNVDSVFKDRAKAESRAALIFSDFAKKSSLMAASWRNGQVVEVDFVE